ncbi:unnamed protein product [Protopolystoma xenopodis]|uniref:Uncharacterized protein n=1 Tax=Protopolystoma xenopodis TaxID=117903 RepID=A0A3S5C4W4_9PLAT|nr:unnamed protein product [Protopolystoma xenopodis]
MIKLSVAATLSSGMALYDHQASQRGRSEGCWLSVMANTQLLATPGIRYGRFLHNKAQFPKAVQTGIFHRGLGLCPGLSFSITPRRVMPANTWESSEHVFSHWPLDAVTTAPGSELLVWPRIWNNRIRNKCLRQLGQNLAGFFARNFSESTSLPQT